MALTKRGLVVVGTTAVLATAVTLAGAGIRFSKSLAGLQQSPKEVIDEVWQVINQDYVDATFNGNDWQAVRKQYLNREYTSREDAYKAVQAMLKELDDPYTRFMDPEQFKSMQIDTSGELTGVGITIAQDEKTKKITVISPIEESPAFKAGILAKDVITQIDGKSTQGMDVNDAVGLIRGTAGTQVNLTVLRNNKPLNFKITRAQIEIHPVRASYRKTTMGEVAHIRLIQFSANAATEMRQAIQTANQRNVAGFVLDLRTNPGGLLSSSTEIARMWLDKGTIVSVVDRQGTRERSQARRNNLTDKPLVVLVDEGSASASEILAGALQDNKRALLVGNKTFGKGLVQSVHPLGDGSGMAVTIAKYFTPKGRDINHKGIAPDIPVKLTTAQREKLFTGNSNALCSAADLQCVKALDVLGERIAAQRGNRAQSSPSAASKN